MIRAANWTALLTAYLNEAMNTPFAWGRHDCVTFACGWVHLITGLDGYARWRGQYTTRFGAARRIAEAGCDSMLAAGSVLFGTPVENLSWINRGDIVLAERAFGIVTGPKAVFLQDGSGLIEMRSKKFDLGWSI